MLDCSHSVASSGFCLLLVKTRCAEAAATDCTPVLLLSCGAVSFLKVAQECEAWDWLASIAKRRFQFFTILQVGGLWSDFRNCHLQFGHVFL